MWIRRATYEDLLKRAFEANGTAQALERQVTTQKVTMDWLMMRLTQLEHERAQLIHRYMGVTISVPSIEPAPMPGEPNPLGDGISFDDMGDEAAKKLGIGWNDDGTLKYEKV